MQIFAKMLDFLSVIAMKMSDLLSVIAMKMPDLLSVIAKPVRRLVVAIRSLAFPWGKVPQCAHWGG